MHARRANTSDNTNGYSPAAASSTGLGLQCKLSIGAVNDPLEAEADAMAERVMRMPDVPVVQRKCAECEKEDKNLQRKPLANQVLRMPDPGSQKMFIQRVSDSSFYSRYSAEKSKPFIQRKPESTVSDSSVPDNFVSSLGAGQPLEKNAQDYFGPRFGTDFSQVRVHTGAQAAESAGSINAKAYTLGNNLVFGAGQYQPGTAQGKQLLAHELTHVVQQAQGRTGKQGVQRKGRPTMELFVNAPFKGRILSSADLKKSNTRAKAYRYTGQLEAQVCDAPDPRKSRQCATLAADSKVRVVRIVNWPILYADDGVWVEGGAGWYEIERPDAPGKTGYLLGVFVEHNAMPPPKDKEKEKKNPHDFDLPVPKSPEKPRGPERTTPDAVETFCKPFKSKSVAMKAHKNNKRALMSFTQKFGSDVQDLWRTYMDTPKTGTKGTLPKRRLFGDPQSRVVKEFRDDPETMAQREILFTKIFSRIKGDRNLIPPQQGQSTKFMPFRTVLKDGDLLNLPMAFKDPFNKIPGLIAGGYGKNSSDAGDDVRNVDGEFAITRTGDFDIRLSVVYIFDIFDAIDFCPGAPGSLSAQLAVTDDLSRLEATPDVPSYDTPFEVVASANKEKDLKL